MYKRNSEKSQKVAKYLNSIIDRLKNLAGVVLIDCDTFSRDGYYVPCRDYEYVLESFPRLRLLVPPERKWDPVTKQLEKHFEFPWSEKEMTENSIYNYITTNIPNKAVKLDNLNVVSFLNNDGFNKIILFTDKREASVTWKGLTNHFYDKILMGEVYKDKTDLLNRFGVTKFPTLILYKVIDKNRLLDEPEIVTYEGYHNTEKLVEFIEPHCLQEKKYLLLKRGIPDNNLVEIARNIELKTVDVDSYEEYLNKFSDKNNLFYFDTKNKAKPSLKQLAVNLHGFFNTVFFDCDKDRKFCLEKFGVTKFPMLKLIPPSSEHSHSVLPEKLANTTLSTLNDRISHHLTLNISKSSNITLENQLKELFPSKVQEVSAIEFPYQVSDSKFVFKYMIVNVYKEDDLERGLLPLDLLSYNKNITTHFNIVSLKDPTDDVRRINKLVQVPGLYYFVLNNDEYEVFPVSRNSFYSSLSSAVSNLLHHKLNPIVRKPFESNLIKIVKTNSDLRRNCLNKEFCVIAFLDARPGEANEDDFKQKIEKMERAASSPKYEKVGFNWVNATCHKEFASKFEIDVQQLPATTFYQVWRGMYANFAGLWEHFTLNHFFERVIESRYDNKEIKREDVFVRNIICEESEEQVDEENTENKTTKRAEDKTTSTNNNQEYKNENKAKTDSEDRDVKIEL